MLALAASTLAASDRQRELAAWVASHDQNLLGLGVVGFDLSALPWSPETFSADRAFVLRTIDAAKARVGWERLGYAPREDHVQSRLDQFRVLIEAFAIEDADGGERIWPLGRPDV